MAMTHKDKIDAIQNALNSNKTLVQILKDKTGGGMSGITGGSETSSALDISDNDISMMLRNQNFIAQLSKKPQAKEKVSKKDQQKYDDYNELRKAARKSLASKTGAINPNNLAELKKVLDKQKPKRTKK